MLFPEEYQLTLLNGTDTVTIGGHSLPNQQILTILNQTEKFLLDPYSGIQGGCTVRARESISVEALL